MASYIYLPQSAAALQQYYDTLQNAGGFVSMPSIIPQQQTLSYGGGPAAMTAMPSAHHYSAVSSGAGLQPLHQLLINSQRDMTLATAGTKRGSEEMLHQTLITNNGTMTTLIPETCPDLEPNDAKKVRLESTTTDNNANQTPSPCKLIEVTSLPASATETDLVKIALPFGKVTNVSLLRQKNKAFIEMADVNQSVACVNYHQNVPATIARQQIFLQFSSNPDMKIEKNAAAMAAISEANSTQIGSTLGDPNDPKLVLHVIVDNLIYTVSIDVLKQIFSRYGQVLKIITFNKNAQFQALIQYSDPISAQTAKVSLDGQNIYNNCCTLRIDFSKLSSLNVKYNNEKSRDYTNPNLPAGEAGTQTSQSPGLEPSPSPSSMQPITGSVSGLQIAPSVSLAQAQAAAAVMAATPGAIHSLHSPHTTHGSSAAAAAAVAAAAAGYGPTLSYMSPPPTAAVAPALHPMSYAVQMPHQGFGGMTSMPSMPHSLPQATNIQSLPPLGPGSMMPMGLPPALASQMAANMAAARMQAALSQTGCVVLVSNLDEEKATPDALFTLFGVYGDVIRVKILYNKKDNALLQYNEPTQAQLALTHLDKIKVWGKQIRVAPSKHPIVQMPTDLQADGAKLTKDFTNSPLHRYKKKGSKNYQNIYPPSATLHLSNIPPDVPGDLLKTEFSKYGKVTAFKFFEKDHKMALIQMETIDDAVMGLIGMHNFQLGETSHLRVSFSKSTINPPPAVISPMSINPTIPVNISAAMLGGIVTP